MSFNKIKIPYLFILLSFPFAVSAFDESTLFKSGEEGYSNYRIPSLITTKDGSLLAFCEARKDNRGDSGNIDLIVKRSTDNGLTWSSPIVVWDAGPETAGNPCPVVDQKTGRIINILCWNLATDHGKDLHAGTAKDTRRVFQTHSDDDGLTWTEPKDITAAVKDPSWWWYATGPGIGIQLEKGIHKGRLVIPANHTTKDYYGAHTLYSDDGGDTWSVSNTIKPTVNESQVVELSDGRLMMNMRSQGLAETKRPRNGYRSIAFSTNGGESWTPPRFDKTLGDPRCQGSIIRFNKDTLLFSNPNPAIKADRGDRIRMTVRSSSDDGKTWPGELLIYEGPSAYSSLAKTPDGKVGLLYEKDTDIAFARIPIEDIGK
jgi:sialidase-1